ncbi:MAG: sulfite exporter TauE/SafE family protein [Rhizobiaceae bacterium]
MFGVDSGLVFTVLCIFLFAGVVKGILGFGLPIITMSLLPFVIPVEMAIALSAVVQPATNIFQLISAGGVKKAVTLSWPVLAALIPGVAVGAWYLTSLDSKSLLILIGFTITTYALFDLLGYKVSIPPKKHIPVGFVFGFVAGIFGALTALNGWAFIIYLVGLNAERNVFRSTIALLFLISGLLISSSFWLLGWLTAKVLLLGCVALLAAFPGMTIGNRIGERLPGKLFRKLILTSLVFVGLFLASRGLI